MSRHDIQADNGDLEIVVGWDPGLSTLFAQVLRPDADEESPEHTLLWIGCTPADILRPEDLITRLAPYAAVSPNTIEELRIDRAEDLDDPPRWLRRAIENLLS